MTVDSLPPPTGQAPDTEHVYTAPPARVAASVEGDKNDKADATATKTIASIEKIDETKEKSDEKEASGLHEVPGILFIGIFQ